MTTLYEYKIWENLVLFLHVVTVLNNTCIRRANVATPPSQNIHVPRPLCHLRWIRKETFPTLTSPLQPMQGSFLLFAPSNASHCDRHLPLCPSRLCLSLTYPNWTHEGWLSTVWKATQIICWLSLCFLDKGEIQISLSLVFWATTTTYSVCHWWILDLVGSVSHITPSIGIKGFKFHNDVAKN